MTPPRHMQRQRHTNLRGKRILLVEDSRMISAFVKRSLEQELGCEVVMTDTLAQTRSILEQPGQEFFAAVLDLNLPDAPDGEVVDLAISHKLPVIVLTSLLDAELRESIESKGVVDYVLKSRDAVRQVLDIVERLERNQGVKILVTDDSGILRRITRSYLERYGFTVLEAKNGIEALEILKQEPGIMLVITDYEMPEMNGFDLCTSIREETPKTRLAIIGVSSHSDPMLSVRLIKAGANDFLAKPFQREELYVRILQNLENLEYIQQINSSLETIQSMNARMKRDLDAAAKLQQSLLPQELPTREGVRLASLFKPCDELAGDTYNLFFLDKDRLGVFVLDVSGHGVPSALLSVTLSRLLKPETSNSVLLESTPDGGAAIVPPGEVCARLNRQFPMNPENFQYFTIVYGILDCRDGSFRYASAGHPGPVLLGPRKEPVPHKTLSMAVGFVPDAAFEELEILLAPGDRLYFYTDGIVEAQSPRGEEFGMDRFCTILRAGLCKDVESSLHSVYTAVRRWNDSRFKDDVTICALEYLGSTARESA